MALYTDKIRMKHMAFEQMRFINTMADLGYAIPFVNDTNYCDAVFEIIKTLRPYTAVGAIKVRIGGESDGGYVMLDPGRDGLAYSFGISQYSPWDLEMAERNFRVYQYDATIEQEPAKHKNIFFNKFNI
jgi:hypothetical protein